jgi:hypothetical protein
MTRVFRQDLSNTLKDLPLEYEAGKDSGPKIFPATLVDGENVAHAKPRLHAMDRF